MYKVTVPIANSTVKRCNREKLLKEIKRFDGERVFLAVGRYETDAEKKAEMLKELADNCKFFKANGLEVGAWLWTFWVNDKKDFVNMRAINGSEIKEFLCPSDENFVKFAADYISDLAKCGVDIIYFDDDFRYGFLSDSPACLCDKHIALINDITGENATREEIYNHIISGEKNKWRDAYLKANGDAFADFAVQMRAAIDKIDPQIRIGVATCMSTWDIDGTDAYSLAKILAGNTKPLTRLIGAPYWAVDKSWGNYLQDVVELERMESVWTKKGDIEIMAEGDVWPRPRINCPASYLEGFDTAIRASGCTDGILKYGLDYYSDADYETGYAKFHEKNKPVYQKIDKMFGGKTNCGVRVYESMKKVADMVMPTKVNSKVSIEDLFFSKAARTLAFNSIPTVYEGEGVCGIVFDENARNLPLSALKNGLILDIAAAEILSERGVDVGIEKIGEAVRENVEEHFFDDNNYIQVHGATFYDIALKDGAEVLSDAETSKGTLPLSYRYENADGNRFLVLNLNTRFNNSAMLKHYERSRQIADNTPWLSGNKLPAYIYGNPALYMQCKENANSLSVGLWNFWPDAVLEPVVELHKEYSEIEFLNCTGKLSGNKAYLSEIAPYGFAGFEVK